MLIVRSEYSFGRGVLPVADLVDRAARAGATAFALADHTLCGQVEFHYACRARGLRPVTGLERPDGRVLLARDRSGWESLCRLLTHREDRARYELHGLVEVREPRVAVLGGPEDRELYGLVRAIHEGRRFAPEDAPALPAAVPPGGGEDFTLDLCTPRPIVPSIAVPPGETADAALGRLAGDALRSRGLGAAYETRLRAELAVVAEHGFAGLFLAVGRIAGLARERGIGLAGRGSAVASLVAYLLGAHDVDPLAHGLFFERFLHPRRVDVPDIDLDVASDRRDELIEAVVALFGEPHVGRVSAVQRFQLRSAYREGLKALGMPLRQVERIAGLFREESPPPPLPPPWDRWTPLLERLVGRPQHLSLHPGGIVLADDRIDRYTPVEAGGMMQLDGRSAALMGLVKIDLLGNRALAVFDRVGGGEAPDADPATLRTLRAADTVGCFQIETPIVRAVLAKLPISGVRDLMAALAIVRPGPAAGRAKADYLRRASGERPSTARHPLLDPWLSDSRGMLLYEEDLMAAIHATTGLPLAEADELRAAIQRAEGRPGELARLEAEFRRSSKLPEETTADLWADLAAFAAYSFNKAHAASYARLAYHAAHLKTHAPAPFAAALLDLYGGAYPLRTVAWDFIRHGVAVRPPSVHASAIQSRVEEGGVRLGLAALKRLSKKTAAAILARRPFADLADLEARLRPSKRELDALVLSGACDGLPPLDPTAYPFAHQAAIGGTAPPAVPPGSERYRLLVRIQNELMFLEMHLSDHPMRVLRPDADRLGCIRIADATGRRDLLRLAAIVAAARRVAAAGGGVLQYVTFEDETGLLEATLRPSLLTRLHDPLTNPGPWLVEGRLAEDDYGESLRIEGLKPFHERET